MSNTCYNVLVVQGEADEIQRFTTQAYESDSFVFCLEKLVDINQLPPQKNAHLHYWGTRYIDDVVMIPSRLPDNSEISYQFVSGNSPPENAVINFSKDFPELIFYLNFEESGCDFIGTIKVKNGQKLLEEVHSFYDFRDSKIIFEQAHIHDYEKDVKMEVVLSGYYLYYSTPDLSYLHQFDFHSPQEQSSFKLSFDYLQTHLDSLIHSLDNPDKVPNFFYDNNSIDVIIGYLENTTHSVHKIIQKAYLDYTLPFNQNNSGEKTIPKI